jgi:hypothetical protein
VATAQAQICDFVRTKAETSELSQFIIVVAFGASRILVLRVS